MAIPWLLALTLLTWAIVFYPYVVIAYLAKPRLLMAPLLEMFKAFGYWLTTPVFRLFKIAYEPFTIQGLFLATQRAITRVLVFVPARFFPLSNCLTSAHSDDPALKSLLVAG
ncbi:MAG: hypothetical protein JW934_20870 [Anaerolineae bacterium]|nr:hypothetical protein [Anaerolineae bacterium]